MAVLANDIRIGSSTNPSFRYNNRNIIINSAIANVGVDVVGNELTIDTFSFSIQYLFDADLVYAPYGYSGYRDTNGKVYRLKKNVVAQYYRFLPVGSDALVDSNNRIFQVFAGYASGAYLNIPYGTPVYWYVSNNLLIKGYTKTVERTGRYTWKITCISGVGLLDTKMHSGGIYDGSQTVGDLAASIIGNTFRYSIDNDVANVPVYGHLPYDTARNNLHRLLFVVGASIVRGTGAYEYAICFLDDTEIFIPSERIAIGGSVISQLPANAVEVTEHAYMNLGNEEDTVLYDNTDSQSIADNTMVVFNDPMHNLQTTGNLTIVNSTVNYALVSGSGTLIGKPYTHTERIVSLTSGGGEQNVKRVKDNHLVSFANSLNIAKRVLSYYKSAKTLKAKIMLQGEKPGNNISLMDAFNELESAFLSKMSISVSTVIAAQCELINGYSPQYGGNNYANKRTFTESGTWTVPNGVTQIRIVLIGGGQGGQGGFDGEDGAGIYNLQANRRYGDLERNEYDWNDYLYGYRGNPETKEFQQYAPVGGAAGNPGSSGLIATYDLNVSAGEVITLTVGVGGTGGVSGGGAGASGTNTTATSTSIGTISSASGVSLDNGYFEPMDGEKIGGTGEDGHDGGNGGMTDVANYGGLNGWRGKAGFPGESVGLWRGGSGGQGIDYEHQVAGNDYYVLLSGGGGGGAAWGANGSNGVDASISVEESETGYVWVDAVTGGGGNGANAVAPGKANIGCGGGGGNGGGGAGNIAGGRKYGNDDWTLQPYAFDVRAKGGNGSAGGDGGDGCVIIYYN